MSDNQLEQLILMVNQIVENNTYHMSEDETIVKTSNHLETFWARSMKTMIIDYVNSGGGKLDRLAKKSIVHLSNT